MKKLLSMMHLRECTPIVVQEEESHDYLGGGYESDVLRRFGSNRVCSTYIIDQKLMIFVKR